MSDTVILRIGGTRTVSRAVIGLPGVAGPVGPPGDPFTEQQFVALVGQTSFVLSAPPTDPDAVLLVVNGIVYSETLDWTRIGATITWLDNFTLAAGDNVVVKYR
jgi:hypothetical protein